MKIVVETIPAEKQRYDTWGDYWIDEDGTIQVKISDVGNENHEFIVAMHELVELWLCKSRGIKFEDIDKYDMEHEESEQPGDDRESPYQNEHNFATGIERLLCAALNIKWKDYDGN